MAGIALELSALAFLGYVMMGDEGDTAAAMPPIESVETPAADAVSTKPMDFITESADPQAQYYRASADDVELIAGFYSDGRVRLADAQLRRFAGLLQGGHADLLDLDNNQWSELFVRTTPAGTMQLELRGGPYDARVLTCESFSSTSSVLRQAQDDIGI